MMSCVLSSMKIATFTCVTWLLHVFNETHSKVLHHSYSFVKHIHIYDRSYSRVWHNSCICVTWLIHMRDVTHAEVYHNSVEEDTTHSYVWHDSFICATRNIHTCDKTYWHMWHHFFICVTWLITMCRVRGQEREAIIEDETKACTQASYIPRKQIMCFPAKEAQHCHVRDMTDWQWEILTWLIDHGISWYDLLIMGYLFMAVW